MESLPPEDLSTLLFEQCAIGMTQVALDGSFSKVNHAMCEFLGYSKAEFVTLSFQQITHPDDLEADLLNVQRLLDNEATCYSMEKLYRHKQGHYLWGKLTVKLVRKDNGEPRFFISVVENIQAQKQAEFALKESEQKFANIVELLSDKLAVWIFAPGRTQTLYVSPGYANVWRRSAESLLANPESFAELIHPQDKRQVLDTISNHQRGNWACDYRIIRDDGSVRYIQGKGFDIFSNNGELRSQICMAKDTTEFKLVQRDLELKNARLAKLVSQDSLTGINNRHEIIRLINEEFARSKRHHFIATLVFIDLNDFKHINDNYGHLTGDKALICFAEHVQQRIRSIDKLGRFGGDEFLLLLPQTPLHEAEQLVERLHLDQVMLKTESGQSIPIGASIGFAQLDDDVSSVETWLEIADNTMYDAKLA